jgi:hypothetical protein
MLRNGVIWLALAGFHDRPSYSLLTTLPPISTTAAEAAST